MPSLGVTTGIDLVHVPRIAARLGETDLWDRVYSRAEQEEVDGDALRTAGRWAAKEAALKALGRGLDNTPLCDVEILNDASGVPVLRLSGVAERAALEAGWSTWSLSISHDGEYAVACVVAVTSR